MQDVVKIIKNGLWTNNQALVALLGLCPLLAVTNSVVNALGLAIATTIVLVLSNSVVSLSRGLIKPEIRIPVFVLLIASFVTIVELLMQAFYYELYLVLGIFVPLIVTNCVILGRAEVFASKNNFFKSLLDGLFIGLGFAVVLIVLGAFREIIGSGTLLSQADLLFGSYATNLKLTIFDDYQGMLLAILPPGAFICLGIIVAIKNFIEQKQTAKNKILVKVNES